MWVGRHLAEGRTPDERTTAAFLADCLDDWAHRVRPMDAPAFAAAHTRRYDELWRRDGEPALATFPPSYLDLGSDARPPLVADDGGRNDWTRGTDRSVYHRYRLALKPRGNARSWCGHPDCTAPWQRPTADPGADEVARACQPYGLAQPAHRQLLRSVHAGFGTDVPDAPRDWRAVLTPCSAVDVEAATDEVIVNAAVGAWASWRRGTLGRLLADELGDLAAYHHVVARVASRRGWMSLHGRESSDAPAARRCWLRGLVSNALYRQAAPSLRAWARGGAPEEAPLRRESTIDLLGRTPTVAVALRDGSEGWREQYLALVDATGPTRGTFLPPADARALIGSLFSKAVAHD